jgi:triosephosphate isomerase (TIM)
MLRATGYRRITFQFLMQGHDMAQRRKIIIGNWKMNGRLTSGLNLAREVAGRALGDMPLTYDIVLCPPVTLVWPIAEVLMGTPVMLGAQDCHYANHGAYTGDVSAGMLADLGCRYVILGHSERRTAWHESNSLVAQKVAGAQLAGLTSVVCVGETLEQRAGGMAQQAILEQLTESLPERYQASQLVIAYEPVWAIGSGETPSLEDIRNIHRAIRTALGASGEAVRVVYGGSVVPSNAQELLEDPDIDGVLVGSASLNSDGFWAIAEKAR